MYVCGFLLLLLLFFWWGGGGRRGNKHDKLHQFLPFRRKKIPKSSILKGLNKISHV